MSKRKTVEPELRNYSVYVKRTIVTMYSIDAASEDEARQKMEEWDVEDEGMEIEQVDWEIQSVKAE